MPLRVRCRCGQELVLRYGEWVYVLVALALLAAFANAIALFVISERLERLDGAHPTAPTDDDAPETSVRAEPAVRARTAGTTATSSTGGAIVSSPDTAAPDTAAEGAPEALGGGRDASEAVRDLLSQLALAPPRAEPPADVAETSAPRPHPEAVPRDTEDEAQPSDDATRAPRPLLDAPRLVRLVVLEAARDDLAVNLACLADPDVLIRSRAARRAKSHPDLPRTRTDALLGALARRAVEVAGPLATFLDARDARPLEEADWALVREQAAALLDDLPDAKSLESALGERAVRDVVLAIDASRSMAVAEAPLRELSPWFLAALEWCVPEIHIGLLYYRDGIDRTVDLSPQPARDLAPALAEYRADGGGDVPEAVHLALEESLRLGSFSWRADAAKDVVIIGDQSPPYREKRGFVSLARSCHDESGFRIHAIGLRTAEDSGPVPYFAECAAAGGGTFADAAPESIASETLRALLGDGPPGRDERLVLLLRSVFAR